MARPTPAQQKALVRTRAARVLRPGSRGPFLIGAIALFVLLTDGNLATPLYAVYRQRFHFSATELTLIFTTYMIVLIPSLLVLGQLSDRVGRRPLLVGGLVAGSVGLLGLAVAANTPWLFAARAVQGASLGAFVATAAAALVELEPDGDHERAALGTVLGQSGGSGAGPLVGGMLAQWAPAPLKLCYLVGIGASLVTALLVSAIHEPLSARGEWRLRRPSVPPGSRVRFARVSLTGACVWSVGALYLSVIPSYVSKLLDTGNLALLGAISALMFAAACPVQVLGVRGLVSPRRAQPAGLVLLVAGLAALVLAFPSQSLVLVLVAAVLAGLGLGLGFFGSQAEINQLAPPERRGEVTAAFITCLYTGVSITVIAVGLLSDALSLRTAVTAASIVIAALAVLTTAWHVAERRRMAIG